MSSEKKQLTSPVPGIDEERHVGLREPMTKGFIFNPLIHFLAIAVLGFLIYSNTFHSPFQWDEAEFLVDNPVVKNLSYLADPSGAPWGNAYALKNRYIGYLTFALNYRFNGFDVTGYHIVNLAIHIINALLVYLLVLFTFRTPYFMASGGSPFFVHHYSLFTTHYSRFFALAVALLFLVHPVQTEAVTYVFQRFASLVAMFYMLSLVLYIKGRLASRQAGKLTSYVFAIVFAVCAMKTKENAVTLPIVITIYEFLFFSGTVKSRLLRLLPFLMTILIIPISILEIEGSFGEVVKPMAEPSALGFDNLSRSEYFLTQFRVIVTYLRLLILPVKQTLIYDYPVYRSFFEWPVLLSFVLLSALFGTAAYLIFKSRRNQAGKLTSEPATKTAGKQADDKRQWAIGNEQWSKEADIDGLTPLSPPLERGEIKGDGFHNSLLSPHFRLIGFGILWFFITLSVESSIIPLALVIDEYRVYLPSVGIFIAAVSIGAVLIRKIPVSSAKVAAVFFLVIITLLSYATFSRNALWESKTSLWEDVLSKNSSSPKVYNNMGIAYYEEGRYEKAIDMYQRAIALSPDNFFAYTNLGVAYASTGKMDAAIDSFTKAIALEPDNSVAYANLARAYRRRGRLDEAAEYYRKAVALNPFDSMAFYGLGSTCMTLGRLDEALEAYSRFVKLSPQNPEAYKSRGIVYTKKGDMRNAREDFLRACTLGSREGCDYLNRIQ